MRGLIGVFMVLGLLVTAPAEASRARAEAAAAVWFGPDGEVLPLRTDDEVESFLRAARVVSAEPIQKGINRTLKLLLELDGVKAHAVFRSVVKQVESGERMHWKHRPRFRDSFVFECAAYELSRMLDIRRIPPTVARGYRGREGSIQIWVEEAMDEEQRRDQGLEPPPGAHWSRQMELQRLFDALIQNQDRNLGNLLIDGRWNIWWIDHTRSFAPDPGLPDADRIEHCPRAVWQRLQSVDRRRVEATLSPYLTPRELRTLRIRWDKLVHHLQARIDDLGESAVLWNGPPD